MNQGEYFTFFRNLWLVLTLKLGTIFTKNLSKILAISLSILIISPFSSRVMYAADFILLGKKGHFLLVQDMFFNGGIFVWYFHWYCPNCRKDGRWKILSEERRLTCHYEHETIIPMRITCKQISCYSHNSVCRWLIIEYV